MKLSEVMWVQAGFGSSRKVMPFVVNKNIICSLSDDRLFQVEENKSMFDNLYEICQNEYGFSTVVMGGGAVHKKEYVATRDITVNASEVKALSKNLTKQLAKSIELANNKEREM